MPISGHGRTFQSSEEAFLFVNSPPVGSTALYVDIDSQMASEDGSELYPYKTIQGAFDAIGDPTNLESWQKYYVVFVHGGTYLENLTWPRNRRIHMIALGNITVGSNGGGYTFDITLDNSTPDGINGGATITLTSVLPTAGWFVYNDITVSGTGAGSSTLFTDRCTFWGSWDFTGLGSALNMYLLGGFVNTVNQSIASTQVTIVFAEKMKFSQAVDVKGLYSARDSHFGGDITVTNAPPASIALGGFHRCEFAAGVDISGPAGAAKMDPVSNYHFKAAGGGIVGGAAKEIIGDLTA